jgi:hypothetical protein
MVPDVPVATEYREPSLLESCLMNIPGFSAVISKNRTNEIIQSNQQNAVEELNKLMLSMNTREQTLLSVYSHKYKSFDEMREYIVSIYGDGVFDKQDNFISTRDGRITAADLTHLSFQLERLKEDADDAFSSYNKLKKERKETRNALKLMQNSSSTKEYVKIMANYKRKMGFSNAEILRFVETTGTEGEDTVEFFQELQDSSIQTPLEGNDDDKDADENTELVDLMKDCRNAAQMRTSMPIINSLPIAITHSTAVSDFKKPPTPPPSSDDWIEAPKEPINIAIENPPIQTVSEEEKELEIL